MRIEVENGEIVCGTESDWKNLPENEHKFLRACYGYAVWVGFTASGRLKMRMPNTARRTAELIRTMLLCAKEHKIEVTEEAEAYYAARRDKASEEELLAERLAYIESKRRAWEHRERTGCDGCKECEQIGDGWFRCQHSGDDLEARFSEVWDHVTQCMIIFHEVGIPNCHCKDYYQERKEYGGKHGQI